MFRLNIYERKKEKEKQDSLARTDEDMLYEKELGNTELHF